MASAALEKEDLFMFLQKIIMVPKQSSFPDTLVDCAVRGQTAKSFGGGQVALVPPWKTTCFWKGGWSNEFISPPGFQRQGSRVTSLQSVLLTNARINTYAATARALAILRLVWFLQTELFHIIGTNWGNGEIILVPEHSDFPLPTSPTLVLKDNNAPVSPCFFTAKKKKKEGELVRSLLHPAGSWTVKAGNYTPSSVFLGFPRVHTLALLLCHSPELLLRGYLGLPLLILQTDHKKSPHLC